ncbi:alpha-tubulin N-acetyltransferase [Sitodiplosis mosellana]|uniref:alpha-tubulin N-acetyltransferase n=1 Tax=Sitodiplosis mosellana TaxID=263140 RepID=UPI002443B61E|nr:alpha-tubulin N-acetyltransferase [Sitodiplosis mosellana]XP_055313346.1 alpha-tubulin N-acetyltransferase [Sitodiplosis mosellana]XP_055313347.1 alpha-tubulin N-acetyltransferase [Sitodiplosis mosellana]XP_055313349.1 alpha-tubulin N-acetyltransferase [Sitodiplosis mosellana]XP_055313350.1 alpha-tubulin N-acetyltransferase [Sitodiplosis mosellana]XP_055313351.1 alpha-tubulin N-acetyltransferase [Sitodiplosis mosellana]XP_055313352.1 alpha-tubulin N-acetyltransferase [Sitodiplosis mosellan
MEFRFDVTPLFKTHIVRVSNNLVPQGFTGDRRSVLDAIAKISDIINELGEASARAQGLSKAVTTAQKLRNSDHIVYLLSEPTGRNGCVTGLLKVGTKTLYVFDENGETKPVPAMCVLDFYVHESRQRAGLGREMFDVMLEREGVEPQKLAIDRPSDKLIAFLRKHYGLVHSIPQMNNFVIYKGFFDETSSRSAPNSAGSESKVDASPNAAFFGGHANDEYKKRFARKSAAPDNLPFVQSSPMGRFGAKRPTCSMAEIIHSSPSAVANEPHSDENERKESWIEAESSQPLADADDVDGGTDASDAGDSKTTNIDYSKSVEDIIADIESASLSLDPPTANGSGGGDSGKSREVKFNDAIIEAEQSHIRKQVKPNKQHTGLKNISSNVGAAVAPSNKMEFDQEAPESFGVVKIGRPIGKSEHQDDAVSTISSINSEGLTEQGYFDLKFYHNKLW